MFLVWKRFPGGARNRRRRDRCPHDVQGDRLVAVVKEAYRDELGVPRQRTVVSLAPIRRCCADDVEAPVLHEDFWRTVLARLGLKRVAAITDQERERIESSLERVVRRPPGVSPERRRFKDDPPAPARDPKITRAFGFPSSATFTIPPVRDFVTRWTAGRAVIVDPFAGNCGIGTMTNDIDRSTSAQHHMDARTFLARLERAGSRADVVILDPPYSPHQLVECYRAAHLKVRQTDAQIAALFREAKNQMTRLLKPGGIALTFGWTSQGFGATRGFVTEEILLVVHGAGRNDTICVAERKLAE